MKSILVVYKSKTGFTQKYVDWITEEISCKSVTLKDVSKSDIKASDLIIYGAGMYAGRIGGLSKFKKLIDIHNKKVIVFATGAAPYSDENVSQIIDANFGNNKPQEEFFYFESGINYEKMGFIDKTIMGFMKKILASKDQSAQSAMDAGISSAILHSFDHSKKEDVKPLISYLKQQTCK